MRTAFVLFAWTVLALARPTRVLGLEVSEPLDFNRDIRPILGRYCLSCHGRDEENRQAGLRLDDRESATAEADSGEVAIVPGEPGSSELIARVAAEDEDTRMPPVDAGPRLDDAQITILRRWIEQGAPYAEHWSFTAPIRPPLPEVQDAAWPRNPIDHFILDALEGRRLPPNPPADRLALLRRVSLDLRGLPPTLEEVEEFCADQRSDAYERMVDRFLDDPAYGEHWARMWLDLARYADSSGYGSDPLRHNMWRFRDWVIDALNRNLPYDQFTIEQLAGDLLPDPTLDQRIATAFHRNTMTNTEGGTDDEEFRVEAVKDRVDTTMQVWMGLTIGCAKCHDHKYDPLTQIDYYRLFAVFNQTQDADLPNESPTIEAPRPEDLAALERYDQQIAGLERQLADTQQQLAQPPQGPSNAQRILARARYVRIELPGRERILSLAEVQVWEADENVAVRGQASQSTTDYEGAASRAIDGNTNGDYFAANSTTHTRQEDHPWWEVDLGADHAVDRIVIWNRTDNGQHLRLAGFQAQLLDADRTVVWQTIVDEPPLEAETLLPRELTPLERQREALQQQLVDIRRTRPEVPTVPIMQEVPPDQRRETHLLVKGNFLTKGQPVEPGVLQNFHPLRAAGTPGRLDVARWLVDPQNPLTARVAVNRLWAQLFGAGLVITEEDFGTQGDAPSHPELLDWLATEYLQRKWDTKQMLRLLVTSATYRQAPDVRPDHQLLDPRNRLLARGPRSRLEAETVRDQALALSGLLAHQMGGPSVYPYQPPGLWRAAFNGERTWPVSEGRDRFRRGLYVFWRRTVPYPSMATFDAPSREVCTMRRLRTNTPLQALVGLNDPVFVEAAQALARRIVCEGGSPNEQRARYGLQLCLCRPPDPAQVKILVELHASERDHYRQDLAAAASMATNPLGPLESESDVADLAAWTVVANVLLNMDSVLNK
ncbi:MAG: DUF1553 domain-containing protein [Pirellulaceae bacterium]